MIQDLLKRVVAAEHLGGQRLRLRFEDGVQGDVDLRRVVAAFQGLLKALEDPAYVARVAVTNHGTIEWPNGVELDPIVLYCAAKGIPVPDFEAGLRGAKRSPAQMRRGTGKRASTARPRAGKTARGLGPK